jgi:FkbM family methyltransferase
MKILRKILKKLPKKYLIVLKKAYYKRQILRGKFLSTEQEFEFIPRLIKPGDRVIDIGANIGHYTLKLSELVGVEGRVLAFEPVPETFDILSSNVGYFKFKNITLINGAVSTVVEETNFSTPNENLYQSRIDSSGDISVMSFILKNLIPNDWPLAFIKVDAEGCDEIIIESSLSTVEFFRPVIMAEISKQTGKRLTENLDEYSVIVLDGSHNVFMVPDEKLALFKA